MRQAMEFVIKLFCQLLVKSDVNSLHEREGLTKVL